MARLRGVLGPSIEVNPFPDGTAVVEAIRAGGVSLTILVVNARTFDVAVAALRRIRVAFESHPVIAYYDPAGLPQRNLLELAQSGISDLVQLDIDDSRPFFIRIIESASRASHAQQLAAMLEGDVPASMRSVLMFGLEHAGRNMDVPKLAASMGLSRRTLSWRMVQQGVPSPRIFLTWCRLLVAALLLEESGRTLDSVADQLNFPGGHALGAVFFRYMGRGIMSLRQEGVLDIALEEFRAVLSEPASLENSLPSTQRQG